MKYRNVKGAYGALQKLMGMDFDVRTAYAIYGMFKKIDAVVQFGAKRERELLSKYNGIIRDDNVIEFVHGEDEAAKATGAENMRKFAAEMNDLYEMEVSDMDGVPPIALKYESFGDQTITPSDFMALDGLVSFE